MFIEQTRQIFQQTIVFRTLRLRSLLNPVSSALIQKKVAILHRLRAQVNNVEVLWNIVLLLVNHLTSNCNADAFLNIDQSQINICFLQY